MQPNDPRHRRSHQLRLLAARAALAWERFWPGLWPFVALLACFVIVSLFGIWDVMPGWLHALFLACGLLAAAALLWRASRWLIWPTRAAALRRIERDSGLQHQALRSLEDELVGGRDDPMSRSMWRQHRQRLLSRLHRLRLLPPRSALPRLDPWAFRAALLLVLVVAVVDAGSQFGPRLARAFTPGYQDHVAVVAPEFALWITPPIYTARPPVHVTAGAETPQTGELEPLEIPVGSEALLQVHHLELSDSVIEAVIGDIRVTFEAVGEGSMEARLQIETSGHLGIVGEEGEHAGWQLEVIADAPPTISFAATPTATHRGTLRVAFEAIDDYGVADVAMLVGKRDAGEAPERFGLHSPGDGPREVKEHAYLDLTAHPLAGLQAILRLEVTDVAGQHGLSGPLELVLPERPFTHPLAQAIIEQRRRLADDRDNADNVARILDRLAATDLAEQSGAATVLALRSARTRLLLDEDGSSIDDVIDMLWETALHVEDGNLSLAERRLRDLQQALQDALDAGASDEELQRLLDEIEQAMDEFLEALARQAAEQSVDPSQMMPADQGRMVNRQELQDILDSVREMLRMGARDAAQQMLAQLQEMLENMRAGMAQQSPGQESLSELREMIQRQQGLLDQSFQMNRQMQRGQGQQIPGQTPQGQQASPGSMQGAQGDQEALRRALGELMQQMGEMGMAIPRALGQAEFAMRDAGRALGEGQPGQAVDPQSQAVDLLQQGGQAMMEQMQQQAGQGQGQGPTQGPGQAGVNRDPLGRSMFNNGGADQFGDFVPDQLDLGRARAILEELYRRSGQRNRSNNELDYIDRLLKRF